MRMYDIISKKRDGGVLSEEEISFFVSGYVSGNIPDYQAAALTMALFLRGMNHEETVTLTEKMAASGDQLDLSRFGDVTVDKHSTGGVGDKTTLVVAPVAAAMGATVAKLSGRGLGHTGGTVDKLESVPGFRTALSPEEFLEEVKEIGLSVAGQSGNLVPADKKLYALRDSTATVESLPLIASSIMSKKLAAGSRSIVLDVKTGRGAFMKTKEEARALARMMVEIGRAQGRRMSALLTDMDAPLGRKVGNSLEMQEALDILQGKVTAGRLYDLCVALAAQMGKLALHLPSDEADAAARRAISSGAAFEKLTRMVAYQGGDVSYLEHPERFSKAPFVKEIRAPESGYLTLMDAQTVGRTCVLLGAGREKKDAPIDYTAGVVLLAERGNLLRRGDPIALLCTSDADRLTAAAETFSSALAWSAEKPGLSPVVLEELA